MATQQLLTSTLMSGMHDYYDQTFLSLSRRGSQGQVTPSHTVYTFISCTLLHRVLIHPMHTPTPCTYSSHAHSHTMYIFIPCTLPHHVHIHPMHTPTPCTYSSHAHSHTVHTFIPCTLLSKFPCTAPLRFTLTCKGALLYGDLRVNTSACSV